MSQTQSMAVANPIPGMLTNAKIYRDGKEQLGVGTVNLPSFDFESASVKGFGIAGDISMPVLGHFSPMSVSIAWTSVTDNAMSLLEPKAHHLDVRGNLQEYDPGQRRVREQAGQGCSARAHQEQQPGQLGGRKNHRRPQNRHGSDLYQSLDQRPGAR